MPTWGPCSTCPKWPTRFKTNIINMADNVNIVNMIKIVQLIKWIEEVRIAWSR